MKYTFNQDVFIKLKKALKDNKDVIFSNNDYLKINLFFQEQMCNISDFNSYLLPQLFDKKDLAIDQVLSGICREIDLDKMVCILPMKFLKRSVRKE